MGFKDGGGEVGGGGVEGRGEGVQVGFHEPGEGLEVDEVDGVGEGGVAEDCLDAAAFLAMAGKGAFGVEEGFGVGQGDGGGLFGKD